MLGNFTYFVIHVLRILIAGNGRERYLEIRMIHRNRIGIYNIRKYWLLECRSKKSLGMICSRMALLLYWFKKLCKISKSITCQITVFQLKPNCSVVLCHSLVLYTMRYIYLKNYWNPSAIWSSQKIWSFTEIAR